MILLILLVSAALSLLPQHTKPKKMALATKRLAEHPQHDVTYIERLESPQEIEPGLTLLVHSLCVVGPLQFVVQRGIP